MTVSNCYEDATRAEAYARLELGNTYYLAFRDLPQLIARHVRGRRALDFGCGTGRSTRFLAGLGFDVVGLDISAAMVARARARHPGGDYRVVGEAELARLTGGTADLILAAFTFDNIPTRPAKLRTLARLRRLLRPGGVLVVLVSTPEIYLHEWASFSTRDFPENRAARSGDPVRIVITDMPDARPVEDVLCPEAEYLELFAAAGLRLAASHRPLGRPGEPFAWVNETRIAPWAIHVLEPPPRGAPPTAPGVD